MPALVTFGPAVLPLIIMMVALVLCLNKSTPFPVHHASPRHVPTLKRVHFVPPVKPAANRPPLETGQENRTKPSPAIQPPSHTCGLARRTSTPHASHAIVSQLQRVLRLNSVHEQSSTRSPLASAAVDSTIRQVIVGPGFGWDWATSASFLTSSSPTFPPMPARASCERDSTDIRCCPATATANVTFPTSAARIRATVAVVGGQHPGPSTLALSQKLKSFGATAMFYLPLHLLLELDVESLADLLRALADDGHTVGLRIESAPISFAAIHSAARLYSKLQLELNASSSQLHLYLPPYTLYPGGVSEPVRAALASFNVRRVSPNWMLNEDEMVGRTVGTSEVIRGAVSERIASAAQNEEEQRILQESGWIVGVSGGSPAEVDLVAAALSAMKPAVSFDVNGLPPVVADVGVATTSEGDVVAQVAIEEPAALMPCKETMCWQVDVASLSSISALDSFADDVAKTSFAFALW